MLILLDSNIWRYIVDADAAPRVRAAARRSKHKIAVAPAVLYEAAHSRDKALRSTLLEVMADVAWKRLMPEAFSEACELKSEVRRVRSNWLIQPPRRHRYMSVLHDWTKKHGGVWEQIGVRAEQLQRFDGEFLQRCRDQAYRLRRDGLQLSEAWREADLKKTVVSFPSERPGWDGTPIEAWRVDGLNVLTASLGMYGHPTRDWIDGEIDIPSLLADDRSLTHFWCHEVQAKNMPRHWVRWGMEFLHRLHKVNDGTAGDIQISTHLVEVDLMITSDQRFAALSEKCRLDAPFRIAESRVVPSGSASIDLLIECLEAG